MASKPIVPVEDYLRMEFEGPDPEYLDGELVERHLGGKPHSKVQKILIGIFLALERSTPLRVFPEMHLRTGPRRFRVADIAVFRADPEEDIPSSPPFITIEIVSPDDFFREIRKKCEEYRAWGVQHIWIVDPAPCRLSVWDNGIHDVPKFQLPEFDLVITPEQVFG